MANKVTVIVPCYNVEKYLDNFFNLLDRQTLLDFTAIFVDDSSTDNTKKILKQYCKNHIQYKLLCNEKNMGAGYSRNRAIEEAQSDYIAFLDADDIFPEDYLEKLYREIDKNDADLAVCDIQVKYDDSFGYRPEEYNKIFKNNSVSKVKLLDNTLAASPTNKMFKRKLILSNLFAEGIINEDIPAILGSILDAHKIAYVSSTYYTYVQHSSSVQNSSLSPKKLDVFKALDILFERKENNKLLSKVKDALVFHQIILFFYFCICKDKHFFQRRKYMKSFYELTYKKYDLRGNHHYWFFIDHSGPLIRIYYKLLLKYMIM